MLDEAELTLSASQIKNTVSLAQALAEYGGCRVSLSHLGEAIESNKQFQTDFRGAGQIENLNSYM